jgi:branched-chain amino acid aminotransferase
MQDSVDPDRRIWLDGAFVPWGQATVHVLSHSMQRGSLVFDYMAIRDVPGRGAAVFRLREHIERFERSCELTGLPMAMGIEELCEACLETVRANPGSTALRISAYLPSVEVGVVPQDDRVAVAIAAYDAVEDIIARKARPLHLGYPTKLWVEKDKRNRRHDIMPPQAKVAGNYVSPMVARWKAIRAGYDDALLLDEDGCIAETANANIFLVDRAGTLKTPPEDNVLLGISRASILEIARVEAIPLAVERLRVADLLAAEEVFLSATSIEAWPVASIDGVAVGHEVPGPVTRRIAEGLVRAMRGDDERFDHWLTYAGL